jgi:hypothetical protein
MHYAPDAPSLLNAIAAFLGDDIRPAIKAHDPALAFRVLIAESLCRIVAGELQSEDMLDMMELGRLKELLPEESAASEETGRSRTERHAALATLNAALAERLREGDVDDTFGSETIDHLKQALREKLMVTNPRFDTSDSIE